MVASCCWSQPVVSWSDVLSDWALITCSRRQHHVLLHHLSDARLEVAILGGVDEGIDTAVDEHQHHGQVVVPSREIHPDYADDTEKE